MRLTVGRAHGPLRGEAVVPGDKSIGHRAVLLSAISDGESSVRGLSGGEDNQRTQAALAALGARFEDGRGARRVHGVGLDGLRAPASALDCGNSGTTMRLLAGLLAGQRFSSQLVGDRYLEARPMARVATPLCRMGGRVEGRSGASGELLAPLTVGGGAVPLRGIDFASPTASAQVKSAVLLAGLYADGPTRVSEPARSRDHTERMLRALGAPLEVSGLSVTIDPRGWSRRLPPADWIVPGDLSSAAFLLAAALVVPGSAVTVRGVCVNPTRTGVLDALAAMGAVIAVENLRHEGGEPVADLTARHQPLVGAEIGGELSLRAIDELPLLAAVAAHARGVTVICDAAELRVKESDRIAAMTGALTALGIAVEERPDGLTITGGPLRAGAVESRGDHRIAMASAVCALGGAGAEIRDADNIATSFPPFVATLRALGAPVEEVAGARG